MTCDTLAFAQPSHDALEGLPAGTDGLQYLCVKYSSLISRLREEVSAKHQAEGEARTLRRRLSDEASLRDAERGQWEEERRTFEVELASLRRYKDSAEEQAAELKRSSNTSKLLSVRCDRLHEACAEEAQKTLQVLDQATAGSEVLLRQGSELTKIGREHAELLAQHRDLCDEFTCCREHLTRWRRTASEMEARAEAASRGRDEAERSARGLQDDLRQALRAASAARAREQRAVSYAGRGEQALRAREARLDTVRKVGRRNAQRATSAERRLIKAETVEASAVALAMDHRDLQANLYAERRAFEAARMEVARAEASEVRAAASTSEAQGELRAEVALHAAARQRAAELEGELGHLRSRVERLDGERGHYASVTDNLRSELKASFEERDTARSECSQLTAEQGEYKRRVDRGGPQLSECRRRLCSAEDTLARAQAEAAEERRARERCHNEVIRINDKWRTTKAQCSQLRCRVLALEEAELRYPSRRAADVMGEEIPGTDTLQMAAVHEPRRVPARADPLWHDGTRFDAGRFGDPLRMDTPSDVVRAEVCGRDAARFDMPEFLDPRTETPTPAPTPTQSVSKLRAADSPANDVMAIRDFIAQEERRLTSACLGDAATDADEVSVEEARSGPPSPVDGAGLRVTSPAMVVRSLAHTRSPSGADPELAALLAAEPRVLRLSGLQGARDADSV